jgi:hypothetical protein
MTQKEGRIWEETEEEEDEDMWEDKWMERVGCQMTQIKWKVLRKK